MAMHFEAARTVFFDGAREDVSLPVSPSVLADRHWPHGLPGALQMERAIDDVESAIIARLAEIIPVRFQSGK